MSIEGILIGLFAIAVGAAWAFYGLRAFVILLPLWAFFVGLFAGAELGQELFGEGFFATVTSWVIALVFGVVLALISYLWYFGAIVLLGGTVGYVIGSGLLSALGVDGILAIVAGIALGAVFAAAVIFLAVPVVLVIFLSAISGAIALVNGVIIALGRVELSEFEQGLGQALVKEGPIAVIGVIAVAIAGILYQTRDTARMAISIDREAYRIS